jgi:hypothetical protein
MADLKKRKCHCCDGSGKELDNYEVGAALRKRRLAADKTLAQIARAMSYTITHIHHLERGIRNWTPDLVKRYEKALL